MKSYAIYLRLHFTVQLLCSDLVSEGNYGMEGYTSSFSKQGEVMGDELSPLHELCTEMAVEDGGNTGNSFGNLTRRF